MSIDESTVDTLSVGAQLRQARANRQLSVTDVAQHLKLSALQIDYIENDDFSVLGLVFSRGFVRQYARYVGLDADALVAAMANNSQHKTESISVHSEQIPLSQGLSKYWFILVITAISIVIGVPIGIYYWLSSDTVTIDNAAAANYKVASSSIKTLAPPTPLNIEPLVDNAIKPKTSPATPINAPTTERDISMGRLLFKFDSDSWVEIRDANKHMILSHLYRAGESAEISGTPPLSLIIGNAAKVSLRYNDQAFDLKPYTGVTTARVTLK